MTIGEKIRYYRLRKGLTQDKLAELTGIHPVSIRKYETNKMHPQSEQTKRIADALEINHMALAGLEMAGFNLKTAGDLYSILLLLCTSGFLQITGERGTDGLIRTETAEFTFNSALSDFMGLTKISAAEEISLKEVALNIRTDVKMDLLVWEMLNYNYLRLAKYVTEHPDDIDMESSMFAYQDMKEKKEMDLQSISDSLDDTEE